MYKTSSKFINRSNINLPIPPMEVQKERVIKVCPKCRCAYSNSYQDKCYICNSNIIRKSGDDFFGDVKFYIIKVFINEINKYCHNNNIIFNNEDFCIEIDLKESLDKLEHNILKPIIIKLSHIPSKIRITNIISIKLIKHYGKETFYSKLVKLCNQIMYDLSVKITKRLKKNRTIIL